MYPTGFIEAIAAAKSADEWYELNAGFFAFRCAETILSGGHVTAQEIDATLERLPRFESLHFRQRIRAIVDRIATGNTEQLRADLGRLLLSYASDLQSAGRIEPALDVFTALVDLLTDEPEIRMSALLNKSWVLRVARRHVEAVVSYEFLVSMAQLHKSAPMQLEGRLGLAKLAIERGTETDLTEAKRSITQIIASARRRNIREIIGKALIDRSIIAGIQRDAVSAIVDTHAALEFVTGPIDRQRLLNNMATAYREVGDAVAATEIADLLAEQPVDSYVLGLALILRYHLAIDADDELGIARVLRRLSRLEMPPVLAAEFFEAVARDHALHDRWSEARHAAELMRDLCAEAKMDELRARAESSLEDIRVSVVPAVYDYRPMKLTTAAKRRLAAVMQSVRQLCAA